MRHKRAVVMVFVLLVMTVFNISVSFAEVISPAEMESLAIEELIKDALNPTSACDCDIKDILVTFAEIQRRMGDYKKANDAIYKEILKYQEKLIKQAEEESKSSGISLVKTVSGQAVSTIIAFSFDFFDEASGFMLKEFSEAGAAATAGRGVYRVVKAAKATAKTVGAEQSLSRIFDSRITRTAKPLPSKYIQLMRKLTKNMDNILNLQRLEKILWDRIYENKDCLKRLEAWCEQEKININYYRKDTLNDSLSSVSAPGVIMLPREEEAYEVWGFKALGYDLGFSREKDDPLSIKNYVIPQLSMWRETAYEIDRLYNASKKFTGKEVLNSAERCSLCETLKNLKILYDLEQEVYRTNLAIKQYLLDHQRLIFGSYRDIQRLWEKSQTARALDSALASPVYIASTTAISFFVPWTGTVFAIGEAGLKIMLDSIDVLVKSGVEQGHRDNIKKFNFQLSLLSDWGFAGKISSAREAIRKTREILFRKLKNCETDRCVEDRLYLTMPESHRIRAVLSQAVDGLQGCWTMNNIYPIGVMSLYIEKTPLGYRAWYVQEQKRIPFDVSFKDGLMVLKHRFNKETLSIYSGGDIPPEESSLYLSNNAELKIELRPYETRSGIIGALAIRMKDNLSEILRNSKDYGSPIDIEIRRVTSPLIKLAGKGGISNRVPTIKILDASSKKALSEIKYGQKIIIQYGIKKEVNCPVEKDSLFVRINPEADPTMARWIELRETDKASGILQSPPLIIDFYLPGKQSDIVSFLPQDATPQGVGYGSVSFNSMGGFAESMGGLALTVKGIGNIRPIEPGTEEAFRYAISSQVSVYEEILEAQMYAQLDPLFGEDKGQVSTYPSVTPPGGPQGGSMFTPPRINIPTVPPPPNVRAYPSPYQQGTAGKSIIPEEYLKETPVKVPIKINRKPLDPQWQRTSKIIQRVDEKYRLIKPLTEKPEWADPRVRQLWLYRMNYKKEKKSYEGLRASLKDLPSQTKKQVQGILKFSENNLKSTEKRIQKLEASLKKTPPVLYKKPVRRELVFEGHRIYFVSEGQTPVLSIIKRRFYRVGDGYELIETEHPVSFMKDKEGTVIWDVNLNSGKEITHLFGKGGKEAQALLRQHRSDMASYLSEHTALRKIQEIYGPKARSLK